MEEKNEKKVTEKDEYREFPFSLCFLQSFPRSLGYFYCLFRLFLIVVRILPQILKFGESFIIKSDAVSVIERRRMTEVNLSVKVKSLFHSKEADCYFDGSWLKTYKINFKKQHA